MRDAGETAMEWAWKVAVVALGIVNGLVAMIWGQLTRRLDALEHDVERGRDELNTRISSERLAREQRDEAILARIDGKHDQVLAKLDELKDAQQRTSLETKDELGRLTNKITSLGG